MNRTHTPGPWYTRRATASVPTTQVVGPRGHIASFTGKNRVADAALSAAAPDLLSELRRDLVYTVGIKRLLVATGMAETIQYQQTEMREEAIRAAIAKATGAVK